MCQRVNYTIGAPQEDELEVVPYRWVVLLTYTLAYTSSAYVMTTFAPISSIVAKVYDVTPLIVNTCVSIFFMSFVLFNFLSVYVLERVGCVITVS